MVLGASDRFWNWRSGKLDKMAWSAIIRPIKMPRRRLSIATIIGAPISMIRVDVVTKGQNCCKIFHCFRFSQVCWIFAMVIGKARMATISGSGSTNSMIGVAISGKPNPNAPLTKQPRSTAIKTARPSADKTLSMIIAAHLCGRRFETARNWAAMLAFAARPDLPVKA